MIGPLFEYFAKVAVYFKIKN